VLLKCFRIIRQIPDGVPEHRAVFHTQTGEQSSVTRRFRALLFNGEPVRWRLSFAINTPPEIE
jgi:hypothetical protein